jgi:Uncharacterized Fe-S protein
MDIKTVTVPFYRFEEIKRDIAEFSARADLNGFQHWIASERYVLDPKINFEPRSIVSAAVPIEVWNAVFFYRGRRYVSVIDICADTGKVASELFGGSGCKYYFDYWLPQKRIAVRAGLAKYGRNNICYVEGMGSLITLFTFITDIPAPDTHIWRGAEVMERCVDCGLCVKNCPTGAILPGRFLIDNERCLSAKNEGGNEPFDSSVPACAHHSVVHCFRCQDICPENAGRYDNVSRTVEFSEEDTAALLSGAPFDKLPPELAEKVRLCDMEWYYASLPRNLSAWIGA